MGFMFEKLQAYQKVVGLADQVLIATSEFPRGSYFLSDQLNRASVSIATNLAEGNGRFTIPDRKNFFMIARGSVQECVALMEIAFCRKLLTSDTHVQLRSDLEEISKMSRPDIGCHFWQRKYQEFWYASTCCEVV